LIRILSIEIRELQEVIEQEKAAEERVRRAKEEAQEIVKRAREKAESIVQALESDPYKEKLRQAKREETARKKAEIEEEFKRKIQILDKTAEESFEKAVEYVVKGTLSAET